MIKVSDNYSKQDLCGLCHQTDSQRHLIESCQQIIEANADIRNNIESRYEDIYSNDCDKLKKIAVLFQKALQTREVLMTKDSEWV